MTLASEKYRRSTKREAVYLNDGKISSKEFGDNLDSHWETYLVESHLEDGNHGIFKKILHEAKGRYAEAKDDFYLGRINITQYIWKRGLRAGEGFSWYDHKMVELGLATQLLPQKDREHFSWKSLKVEMDKFPHSMISPDNLLNCPPENEEAAAHTIRIFFECLDLFNDKYVPTITPGTKVRDLVWVELPGEYEAFDLPYIDITVTSRERRQYERWRDGITTRPGNSLNSG